MVRRICFTAVFALIALPAFAASASCEKTAYAPSVMQSNIFGQQTTAQQKRVLGDLLGAYAQYEVDLKSYRNCLNAATRMTSVAMQKAAQDNKPSEIEIQKAASINLSTLWNQSVDEETSVVNEMTALAKIYCSHATDPGICHNFHL